MQKKLQERSKKGISLISLIITIIVIIILAAIVIFTGLGTPDSANFAQFTQQVDNVYMAVLNKHADLKTKHAIAGHYRTDEQIYIELAVAHDPEQYATMGTTVVNNDNTGDSIGASTGIQNIDPNHSNESNNPSSLGMNLPKVRESNQGWYVTKEGRVFNANGYVYDGKTYFSGSLYQVGSLPASDTRQEENAEKVYIAIQNDTNVVTGATGTGGSVGESTGGGGSTGGETPTPAGLTATINGETVSITSSNFKDYLGKVVTNFKNTRTGTETVTVGSKTYTVSKQYRLYWIDFAGTYGEEGTVYLKADYPGSTTALSISQNTDASIIMKFNKKLGESDITAKANNNNMKAVTWLLDSNNWASITTNDIHTDMSGKILQAYAAPSIEMFMDSYNAYYENKGVLNPTPDNASGRQTTATDRLRLACSYASGNNGYQVKPGDSVGWQYHTAHATVQEDSDIGTMYYPGSNTSHYWLASPSALDTDHMMYVYGNDGGDVGISRYNGYNGTTYALCPIVSLKSNVQLNFD